MGGPRRGTTHCAPTMWNALWKNLSLTICNFTYWFSQEGVILHIPDEFEVHGSLVAHMGYIKVSV